MPALKKADQRRLRRYLTQLGAGQAESEDAQSFARRHYPVAEHARAFDPDVVLIVGERGTGKSALFRAVYDQQLLAALARHARDPRLPSGDPTWRPAHPLGRDFPDFLGLRRCLEGDGGERALKLWFAYLVRVLGPELETAATSAVRAIWEPAGAAPGPILEAFDAAGDDPLLALDALDERLQKEDRWIFVGYDELDTIGGYDWAAMGRALRGLVGFWASYSRRWRRLRAKIFLRTDLFRRHADFGGADLAKLAANRAELTWSDRNLYAMLIKRIASADDALFEYCRNTVRFLPPDPDLGHIPDLGEASEARPLIERMVGQFMGAGEKKGRTFTWILDHLRDAQGHVAPRSLVRLLEQAAQKEAANSKARIPRLLHPTALRQALEDVSSDHVQQGYSSEWPWLYGLRQRVQGQLMPMKQTDLRKLLSETWGESWGSGPKVQLPVATPEELLDYLAELGVLRERPGARVDFPDIYLFGLGLKRKGGVRKGK